MKEFGSFYKVFDKRKHNTWCKYTKRLDMYGCGCFHDCKYCYAKSLLHFRKNWDAQNPRTAYISEIIKTIELLSKDDVVKIGGMTDCFQPVEKDKGITYQTIKALNKRCINYLIVTKSNLVSDDKYINIYDKELAHFQITITCTNDEKCLEYEKAPPVSERIKSIEKLYRLGFDVSIRLSPAIEPFIEFKKINSIKCNKILIEFLKVSPFIKKWFDIDYSKYTLKHGGYNHLDLNSKIKVVDKIKGFEQMSIGEYVKDHYKYFKDSVNYNKEDCCNLDIKSPKREPEQLSLELA